MKYDDMAQEIYDNHQEPEEVIRWETSNGQQFDREEIAQFYQLVMDTYERHGEHADAFADILARVIRIQAQV